jgi:streptogramin lyase
VKFSAVSDRLVATAVAIAFGGCAGAPSSTPQTPQSLQRGAYAAQRSAPHRGGVGTITEYAVPTTDSGPFGIVAAPDGALWFSEQKASKIARVTTAGKFSEYATPTSGASPAILTVTSDPNFPLWFTESAAGNLALLTLSGNITEIPIPKPAGAQPSGIAAGPPGNEAVWYTNIQSPSSIGRINSQGRFRNFPLAAPGDAPMAIAVGPDGALWFTEFDGGKIGRITIKGKITEYPLPKGAHADPNGIVAGPDGALWFTDSGTDAIGRIDTKGHVTTHRVPVAHSVPLWIAVGPDGALWFTLSAADDIGRLDPATGTFSEYPIPTSGSCATDIAAGPDNAMWFTEFCSNKIGRISTS